MQSYLVIFLAQLVIIGGTITYFQGDVEGAFLAYAHIGAFVFLLIAFEITYQFVLTKEDPYIETDTVISLEEFK